MRLSICPCLTVLAIGLTDRTSSATGDHCAENGLGVSLVRSAPKIPEKLPGFFSAQSAGPLRGRLFLGLLASTRRHAALSLLAFRDPEHSPVHMVIAPLSSVVMPFLSWFERGTGRELGSASLIADSRQTLICTYLSAALLAGLPQ